MRLFCWQEVNSCLCRARLDAEKDAERMKKKHNSSYMKGYLAGILTFEMFFRDEILGRKNKIADSLRD